MHGCVSTVHYGARVNDRHYIGQVMVHEADGSLDCSICLLFLMSLLYT